MLSAPAVATDFDYVVSMINVAILCQKFQDIFDTFSLNS